MAKRKLDEIMAKKGKGILWDSDADLDDMSISAGELSELDSEVDSLGSIVSCANSWIEDARYVPKAEALLKYSGWAVVVSSRSAPCTPAPWLMSKPYPQHPAPSLTLLKHSGWAVHGEPSAAVALWLTLHSGLASAASAAHAHAACSYMRCPCRLSQSTACGCRTKPRPPTTR